MGSRGRIGTSLHRRPNGRPAACDPCRLRKVACDHARPVCTRCYKSRRETACMYSATALRKDRQLSLSPPTPLQSIPSSATPPSALEQKFKIRLGHISSLEEIQTSLVPVLPSNMDCDNSVASNTHEVTFGDLPHLIQETCLEVLRALPGQSNEHITYRHGTVEATNWTDIAVHQIISSLKSAFHSVQHLSEREALQTVAERLCANTCRHIQDDISDWRAWVYSFSGSGLRWESIGLLWVHLERVSDMFAVFRPRRLVWSKNRQSREVARSHVGYCIQLATHFNSANDLLVDLLRRKATMNSHIDGDAGEPALLQSTILHGTYITGSAMSTLTAKGAVVSAMTFLGMQNLEDSPHYFPTAQSENRRRVAAQIFTVDKAGVVFSGRLSQMSHRYFLSPLPLDLRDEDLVGDAVTLKAAVDMLDEKGWSSRGTLCSATIIRARCMMALIRDELVEVALGKSTHVSFGHLLDIKTRQVIMLDEFPTCLQFSGADYDDKQLSVVTVYIKTIIHLEYLLNIFFVERLLLRHNYPSTGDLLNTSFTMVSIILRIWTHKDRFSDEFMRRDFEWFIFCYGAPGAGILCQELLHPTPNQNRPESLRVSPSSIVQQLSLLVAFFDWVLPFALNAKLCTECRNIIQRVLNQHLDSETACTTDNNMGWDLFGQPSLSFELMDTFDWLRSDMQL